jgi:hypothetical protein
MVVVKQVFTAGLVRRSPSDRFRDCAFFRLVAARGAAVKRRR